LQKWDSKHPDGSVGTPSENQKRSALNSHRYAVGYQSVNNHGGHSTLNIWQPVPITGGFSLSQVWYAGGSPTQTVEVGSQVYPNLYGTSSPCLFVYWTADGYSTTGCYNNGCGAFVQVSSVWIPGGSLAPVSSLGGTQYEIEIVVLLSGGNWWISINGAWLGYYPGTLYGSGQLKTYATVAEYGGEVTPNSAGTTGQMGSGRKASDGFQWAAYQKNIYYYDTTANSNSAWTALSPIISCSSDYTLNLFNYQNTGSGTYFYFGGQSSQAANCV